MIPAREYFLNKVVAESAGVPLAIVETIERLRGQDEIEVGQVRSMFVHEASRDLYDAAPILLVVLVTLIIAKFFNRGMARFDMYAIFGALTGFSIILRYFMSRTSREAA